MDPLNGRGTLTQPFGANPQFSWQLGYGHLGVDYAAGIGTDIVSIAPGIVLFADWGQNMPAGLANECMFIASSPNNGICVVIQHDGWRSIHCHMNGTHLNAGDRVVRGQVIGKLGTTGNSTGPHVHAESWDRVPALTTPKYSRYDFAAQIRLEDSWAGAGTPVTPAAPTPVVRPDNQRLVGPNGATGRALPFQGAPGIGRTAAAGTWETFTKWTHGEMVVIPGEAGVRQLFQSDVWYGDSTGWYWAGNFNVQHGNAMTYVRQNDVFPAHYRHSWAAPATQRSAPTSRAGAVREIPPYSVEQFSKWTAGENVTVGSITSNIWYGDSAGWVWSGMFTEQSGRGLTEQVTETVLPANQRKTGPAGGSRRSIPATSGTVVEALVPDRVEVFSHWVRGENVTIGTVTSNLWYKDALGYAWAGLFTEQKTDGLPEFVFNPLTTPPSTGTYTFTKAFDMVTEVRPAAPSKFEPGNFPAAKDVEAAFLHQFNGAEVAENATVNKETVHLDSVINTFTVGDRVASAHFGVEGTRVVQFLDLDDRAYAQGAEWNGRAWSIETYGAQDSVTRETAAKLVRELEKVKGGTLTLKKHKDVMATACGNGVDLAWYNTRVAQLRGTTTPPVEPPPVVTPPVVITPPVKESAESLLGKIRDQINSWFAK